MSADPSPPGRVDPNTRVSPSHDKDARDSPAALLMPLSSCTAVPHGSSTDERDAVQMSVAPSDPVRVESQTISSPSWRTFGRASLAELLTPPEANCAGPKLTL